MMVTQLQVKPRIEGGKVLPEPVSQRRLQHLASCYRVIREFVHHVPDLIEQVFVLILVGFELYVSRFPHVPFFECKM